ncbi:MAG TPA: arginine--tRNA ligase [Calditrichaeota bacterium]|nr:arginine--tRNA ligase [Calditrichota bacterium]
MMIRQEIAKLIQKATGARAEEICIERPPRETQGDYSTNIALLLKRKPAGIIKKLKSDLFEKVETAGPGFINFYISRQYLQKQVAQIIRQGKDFGRLKKKGKVNIEFVSANPTGPLHIGNGRSAFAGDVIARVLQKAGYRVVREYFINDAKNSGQIRELGKTGAGEGQTYLNHYLRTKIQNSRFKIQSCKLRFKNKEKLYKELGFFWLKRYKKTLRFFWRKN